MNIFVFPRSTHAGAGSVKNLGSLAREAGRKAFVLVYNNSPEVRYVLEADLKANGVRPVFCETVDGEPDIEYLDACAAACSRDKCDLVISVGGGSVIDTGKIVAILDTNGGSTEDYQMGGKAFSRASLPHIAVPTTAGTGSEATRVAVVTNKKAKIKKSINHPSLVPTAVILDPELTRNLPPRLTLLIGLDALSHAMESYVSLNANPFTEAFAAKAIELVVRHLARSVRDGRDMAAREAMLTASHLAGLSLSAGVGCAHILAQPLSSVTGLPHGLAIALLLPGVVEANYPYSPGKYARIAGLMGEDVCGLKEGEAAALCAEALRKLYGKIEFSETLGTHGVEAASFAPVMESAAGSTRHIATNPRPVTDELLIEILAKSL